MSADEMRIPRKELFTRTLQCQTGGHSYAAPLQRGRIPHNCPDHGGPRPQADFAAGSRSAGMLAAARAVTEAEGKAPSVKLAKASAPEPKPAKVKAETPRKPRRVKATLPAPAPQPQPLMTDAEILELVEENRGLRRLAAEAAASHVPPLDTEVLDLPLRTTLRECREEQWTNLSRVECLTHEVADLEARLAARRDQLDDWTRDRDQMTAHLERLETTMRALGLEVPEVVARPAIECPF